MAAVQDRQVHYERLFGPAHERPLPQEYRDVPGVADLSWRAYPDVYPLLPEDVARLGRWATSKPHWPGETLDGHPYLAVQVGWVWVGQRPTTEDRPA